MVSATPKLSAVWHVSVWRKEVVHEIDIAHQCGVPERSVDRVRLSAADQRARAGAAELCDLLATGLNRAGAQGGNAAAQRVQDVNRQLLARLRREVGELSAGGVPGEGFDLSHDRNPLFSGQVICLRMSGR